MCSCFQYYHNPFFPPGKKKKKRQHCLFIEAIAHCVQWSSWLHSVQQLSPWSALLPGSLSNFCCLPSVVWPLNGTGGRCVNLTEFLNTLVRKGVLIVLGTWKGSQTHLPAFLIRHRHCALQSLLKNSPGKRGGWGNSLLIPKVCVWILMNLEEISMLVLPWLFCSHQILEMSRLKRIPGDHLA